MKLEPCSPIANNGFNQISSSELRLKQQKVEINRMKSNDDLIGISDTNLSNYKPSIKEAKKELKVGFGSSNKRFEKVEELTRRSTERL